MFQKLFVIALTIGLVTGCEMRIHTGTRDCQNCPDGICLPPSSIPRHTPQINPQPPSDNDDSIKANFRPAVMSRLIGDGETPVMDIPLALREKNWGGGSCVHASTVMCLRWAGLLDLADYWRKTYSGGESLGGLVDKMQKNGVQYCYTGNGDDSFLEWATRTRRGAVIFYFPNHSICFAGFQGDTAYLMDNNRIGSFLQVPKAEFIKGWHGYGGVALTPLTYKGEGTPPPPLEWVSR